VYCTIYRETEGLPKRPHISRPIEPQTAAVISLRFFAVAVVDTYQGEADMPVNGDQYPLRIGICLHCVCSVSAIHFHQGVRKVWKRGGEGRSDGAVRRNYLRSDSISE
jgi:hypothetical protein